jgi:hypothetical protein
MALQVINNGESGLSVRQKLNAMLAELYGALPSIPTFLRNKTGAQTFQLTGNCFLIYIFVKKLSTNASISIGTSIGGSQLAPATDIGVDPRPFLIQQPYSSNTTIYFTITGTVDIRIEPINTLF